MSKILLKKVGVIIHDGEGHYLILRRNPSRWQGWGLITGKVEQGESLEDTAIREVEEELGIKIHKKNGKRYLFPLEVDNTYLVEGRNMSVSVKWFRLQLPIKELDFILQRDEWIDYKIGLFEEVAHMLHWEDHVKILMECEQLLFAQA